MNCDQVKSCTHYNHSYGCWFLASTLFLTFLLKEISFMSQGRHQLLQEVSAGLIWSSNSSHSLWLGCLVFLHFTNKWSLFRKHFLGIQNVSGTVAGLKMIVSMTRYKFTFRKEFIFTQFYYLPTRKYESKQFLVWEGFPDCFPQWL